MALNYNDYQDFKRILIGKNEEAGSMYGVDILEEAVEKARVNTAARARSFIISTVIFLILSMNTCLTRLSRICPLRLDG